jgi:hypothetical protein
VISQGGRRWSSRAARTRPGRRGTPSPARPSRARGRCRTCRPRPVLRAAPCPRRAVRGRRRASLAGASLAGRRWRRRRWPGPVAGAPVAGAPVGGLLARGERSRSGTGLPAPGRSWLGSRPGGWWERWPAGGAEEAGTRAWLGGSRRPERRGAQPPGQGGGRFPRGGVGWFPRGGVGWFAGGGVGWFAGRGVGRRARWGVGRLGIRGQPGTGSEAAGAVGGRWWLGVRVPLVACAFFGQPRSLRGIGPGRQQASGGHRPTGGPGSERRSTRGATAGRQATRVPVCGRRDRWMQRRTPGTARPHILGQRVPGRPYRARLLALG